MTSLSLIIPAYNEESRIFPMLRSAVHYLESRSIPYEVIIVDDGSTDSTVALLEKFTSSYPTVKLIRQSKNQGKGAAVKVGMLAANNEFVLFSDADGSTPIEESERLREAIIEGADVAIGSRAMSRDDATVETVLHRRLLGRLFNAAVNVLLLPDFKDTQCGFKMFKRSVAQDLFPYSVQVDSVSTVRFSGLLKNAATTFLKSALIGTMYQARKLIC